MHLNLSFKIFSSVNIINDEDFEYIKTYISQYILYNFFIFLFSNFTQKSQMKKVSVL